MLIASDAPIKFTIGLVSLEAKEIAIEVDKNKSNVTTIIYIIAKVTLIPV